MIKEIAYADKDEWLAIRRGYIGGSEAGALMGLNPYESPYSLWAKKTGRVPEFAGNVTTKVGAYLEDLVAHMFTEETGKAVRRKNRVLVNDLYPFACADVDRLVVGEKALLEIKTTNSLPVMRKVAGGEYPESWYCQMTHYLAVTGLERAYLAALVNCRELYIYTLERDQAEIDTLMASEAKFWLKVKADVPPAPDGAEATTDAIATIYTRDDGDAADLFGRETMLGEYMDLRRQATAIKDRMDEIANIIKLDLSGSSRGECSGYTVSWKAQTRKTFQVKDFQRDHPDVDLTPYYKSTTTRPFTVTEKNNKEDK